MSHSNDSGAREYCQSCASDSKLMINRSTRLFVPAQNRVLSFPCSNINEEETISVQRDPRNEVHKNSLIGEPYYDIISPIDQSSHECKCCKSCLEGRRIESSNDICVNKFFNKSEGDLGNQFLESCKTRRSKCQFEFIGATSSTFNPPKTSPVGLMEKNDSFDQHNDKSSESPLTARIPSPSSVSSITSGKRLEWDSGADVGYIFTYDDNKFSNENLSTIERYALVRGCSTALFKRLDPEGNSGPPKPITNIQGSSMSFNTPVANSTPMSRSENKHYSKNEKVSALEFEPPETVLPGGCLYLHCDQEFENEVAPSGGNNSESSHNSTSEEGKSLDKDFLHKKHSNSLTNLRSHIEVNTADSALPRSQSFLNLSVEKNNMLSDEKGFNILQKVQPLVAACSVSSSSVATIVQKPVFRKMCDKTIQTLPLKLSIGVQVSPNTSGCVSPCEWLENNSNFRNNSCGDKQDDKFTSSCTSENNSSNKYVDEKSHDNNVSESFKCTGAYRKGTSGNIFCASLRKEKSNSSCNVEQKVMSQILSQISKDDKTSDHSFPGKSSRMSDGETGTSDSATCSSQTDRSSGGRETNGNQVRVSSEGPQGSTGVVDSANSFEYLPGEIFESSYQKLPFEVSRQPVISHISESQRIVPSTHVNVSTESKGMGSNTKHNSLSKGVEDGVELLQRLIMGKAFKGKMKKKLIQEIVDKLVNSDFDEDDNTPQESVHSSNSAAPSNANSNRVKTNSVRQHLGSGDWTQHDGQSGNESTVHSGESKNTSVLSVPSETRGSHSVCTPSGSISVPGDNEESQAETTDFYSNSVSRNGGRNWKLPTSRAEEHFESQRTESATSSNNTPTLVKLCRTEHVKQLEWIKFEINHLTHLKQLLEKQEGITKSLSKLSSHEHKFHKMRSDHLKSSLHRKHKRNFSKEHINGVSDTSNQKCFSESQTSGSNNYQENSTTNYHHTRTSDVFPSRVPKERKGIKEMDDKQELSSQGSFNLSTSNVKSDEKDRVAHCLNSKRGLLNVCIQTSPQPRGKLTPLNPNSFCKPSMIDAQEGYEAAVKCCCECKRALEAIAMRQKQGPIVSRPHVHKFCKHHMNASRNQYGDNIDNSSNGVTSRAFDDSTNEHYHVRRSNDDSCVRKATTNDILSSQVAKDVNNHNEGGDLRRNHHNMPEKYCPCCERSEYHVLPHKYVCDGQYKRQYNVVSQQSSRVGNKVSHDAMVQTNIKEPLAYLLTFEPTSNANRENRNSLPEIKLLVPTHENVKKVVTKNTHVENTSEDSCKENQCPLQNLQNSESSVKNQPVLESEEIKKYKLTLQEYLQANRPEYIKHADKRSQCLADLALLRDLRKQKRLELLKMTHKPETTESKDTSPDERVILKGTSVASKHPISSRMMRVESRKKYQRTKEIQAKLAEKKKKEDFRTNRLMAELFTKKLQKRALQGVVNHSSSTNVSSIC